jgi:hypothetical protein
MIADRVTFFPTLALSFHGELMTGWSVIICVGAELDQEVLVQEAGIVWTRNPP